MRTKGLLLCLILLISELLASQTMTETQMRNARATGYAIVAARNPGKSFSIFMIPWDGINTLEYNANNQINSGWHPQAVVKGNYFYQPFDGNDFSSYSSVTLSQAEFDQYKNVGTQWWIVCSTLPSFSCSISTSNDGNVGIGTTTPASKLEVFNTAQEGQLILSTNDNPSADQSRIDLDYKIANTNQTIGRISSAYLNSANGGSGALRLYTSNNGVLGEKMKIDNNGNVGIGTTNPAYKLDVLGTIRAKEVLVNLDGGADFVFEKDYKLPTIEHVATYVQENKHLPDIPSANEMTKNGVSMGDMQVKLLQKVEELTLYVIELNKKNESLEKQIKELKENK